MAETPYNYEARRGAWAASKERIQETEALRDFRRLWLDPTPAEDDWVRSLSLGGEPLEEVDDWDTAPLRPKLYGTAGEWPEEEFLELQAMAADCCEWRGVA